MQTDQLVTTSTAIDRSSPLPLYAQLKQFLLRQIQSGALAPGASIPPENELEREYGVSRITVRRALAELATEGYVSRQAGRGTFVLVPKLQDPFDRLGGIADRLAAQGLKVTSQILDYGRCPASPRIAEKLCIQEGQLLLHFRRLMYADDEPVMLSESFFNVGEEVQLTPDVLRESSIYPLLEDRYGIMICRAERSIEAILAQQEAASTLRVGTSTPMLKVEQMVYDAQDQPRGYVRTLIPGSRFKYYHTWTRVDASASR